MTFPGVSVPLNVVILGFQPHLLDSLRVLLRSKCFRSSSALKRGDSGRIHENDLINNVFNGGGTSATSAQWKKPFEALIRMSFFVWAASAFRTHGSTSPTDSWDVCFSGRSGFFSVVFIRYLFNRHDIWPGVSDSRGWFVCLCLWCMKSSSACVGHLQEVN